MENQNHPSVAVIVPVYRPGEPFGRLLRMLGMQTYPADAIILINTEQEYWDASGYDSMAREMPKVQICHITKEQFDHGGTRNLAAARAEQDILVFMTDDAVPADRNLLEELVRAFSLQGPEGETVAAAYARQLPNEGCGVIERYTREFNYPPESRVKTRADLPELGIKTYFCSNVCCAYRRDIFQKQGGFLKRTLFNEDMIFAAGLIQSGYAVAYAAGARVFHSHDLTPVQQFRRNFDLAVSQADHPEVFADLPSEGEGKRLVKQTAWRLVRTGQVWQLPALAAASGCKYLGYRMGKAYKKLPRSVVLRCTMNPDYWKKKKRRKRQA